jgi:hypothetical protein
MMTAIITTKIPTLMDKGFWQITHDFDAAIAFPC